MVHGNLKLTGHLMQPSDKRAKQDIEEVIKSNFNICLQEFVYSSAINSKKNFFAILQVQTAMVQTANYNSRAAKRKKMKYPGININSSIFRKAHHLQNTNVKHTACKNTNVKHTAGKTHM